MLQTILSAIRRRRGGSGASSPPSGTMLVVAVLASVLAASSTVDGAVRPTPLDYEMHALDNGLRAILSDDDSTPIVHLQMVYHVGSKNEPPGRTGFAHLFEHMMFKGSKNVLPDSHLTMSSRVGPTGTPTPPRTPRRSCRLYFGRVPKAKRPLPRDISREPPSTAERRVTLPQSDNWPLPAVIVAHHITYDGHPDACPLHIATKVLFDGESSRIYRPLVYEEHH